MQSNTATRAAFTLIELLVVIAIIGILVGMTMPAVQQVREAARRTQCQNHLRQVGLAYQNHASTFTDRLPPGWTGLQWFQTGTGPQPSGWGIHLLPYIEQGNLYQLYSHNQPFWDSQDSQNQMVSNTRVDLFLCPSAPEPQGPYTAGFGPIVWQAYPSSYSPMWRVHESLRDFLNWPQGRPLEGALSADQRTRLAMISDGLSNTVLVGEIAGKNQLYRRGRNTGQTLSGQYGGFGGWADATSGASALYGSSFDGEVAPGACAVNCSNDFGLYAFHPGGANVVMADGSTTLFASTMGVEVLAALITRAGGETTTVPQ